MKLQEEVYSKYKSLLSLNRNYFHRLHTKMQTLCLKNAKLLKHLRIFFISLKSSLCLHIAEPLYASVRKKIWYMFSISNLFTQNQFVQNKIMSYFSKEAIFMLDFYVKSETFKV